MDNHDNQKETFELVRNMIAVSKAQMNQDGILLIVWGWVLFVTNFILNYLPGVMKVSNKTIWTIEPLTKILPGIAAAYTLYYLFKKSKVRTFIGTTIKHIWIGLIIVYVLANLIISNVLGQVSFQLQHPLFMLVTGFAIAITGSIIRTQMLVFGGFVFALLALLASYFDLQTQLLIKSIGWLVAFIIPGHILFASRNKKDV